MSSVSTAKQGGGHGPVCLDPTRDKLCLGPDEVGQPHRTGCVVSAVEGQHTRDAPGPWGRRAERRSPHIPTDTAPWAPGGRGAVRGGGAGGGGAARVECALGILSQTHTRTLPDTHPLPYTRLPPTHASSMNPPLSVQTQALTPSSVAWSAPLHCPHSWARVFRKTHQRHSRG